MPPTTGRAASTALSAAPASPYVAKAIALDENGYPRGKPRQLSGADAMKQIRTLRPECRVVMMTGRPPDEQLVAELRKADAHVLKPFRCQELIDCLHRVAV